MRRLYSIYLGVSLLLLCLPATAQQQDTTKNEEEILVASELFQKSDAERRLMLLRPRFRYINMKDRPFLIKVGYRPDLGITSSGTSPSEKGFAHNIVLSYEKLFKNSPFSWNVETFTRLGDRPMGTFEYLIRRDSDGEGDIANRRQEGGEYYNHRFRVHLTLRFYYNKNKRSEAGASGNNTASEYVFFRMRDMLAYTEKNDYRFTSDQKLERHVFSKEWLLRPSYFSVGWGIQRSLLNKGLIDFNVEFGKPYPLSDFRHHRQNLFFDINLFIGLGL